MNHACRAGYTARRAGLALTDCPYGRQASAPSDSIEDREQSPLCLRHWWMGGWHDADIDRGCVTMRGAA